MTADRSDVEQAPGAVDSHCHLFLMEADPADVVEAARAAGVSRMICVGIDPDSSRRSLELAESFRGVFASAGVHPHTASDFDRRAGSVIEELLADPLVVAVGETGLDHYRRLSPPEEQERAFRTHIALSRETGKPLVVHVREAWPDALRILEEERAERVVLHCFSGDPSVAAEANRRGYVASFAGNITYPNAGSLRDAAAAIEDGRLLMETDSPFLPPQRLRGTANTPSNVMAVAETIAEIRGVTPNDIVTASSETASKVFDLPD
jgi:TatD DNase family protein